MKKLAILAVFVLLVSGCIGQDTGDNMIVEKGDTVSVYYTGTLEDGTVFDSNEGKQALTFVAGAGQMISGFDKGVIGMKLNEEKTITIPPEEAYGTSGPHPLAGKTLIFKVRVADIKK